MPTEVIPAVVSRYSAIVISRDPQGRVGELQVGIAEAVTQTLSTEAVKTYSFSRSP